MTVKERLQELIRDFDVKFGSQKRVLLGYARIIHQAETRMGAKHPAVTLAWRTWAPVRTLWNKVRDDDAADKRRIVDEARIKGGSVREIHQTIQGVSGLDPVAGWGDDARTERTGEIAGLGAVSAVVAISAAVAVIAVAVAAVMVSRYINRMKELETLDAKLKSLDAFFANMETQGWTKTAAASAARTITAGAEPSGIARFLPLAIGAGALALVFLGRRK